eukprot:11188413-Lingulodinium_polyedra.AAC.1
MRPSVRTLGLTPQIWPIECSLATFYVGEVKPVSPAVVGLPSREGAVGIGWVGRISVLFPEVPSPVDGRGTRVA